MHVLNRPQVLRVHDVGAMLVFKHRHKFARPCFLLQQDHGHDVARACFPAFIGIVFPAAGVGARALVGVTMRHVARQQAATGMGDAQGAMHEDFKLHIRALLTNMRDFLERQFARQNDPAQSDVLPELYSSGVDDIGLHGQVYDDVWPLFAHHHDQPGIRHDQRIGAHFDNRLQIPEIGFYLVVVWRDIAGEEKQFARGVRFRNSLAKDFFFAKFVVSHAQAVPRLAGIDGIGAVREGVTHVFEATGR